MGEQQAFGVIVWGYDQEKKKIAVKLPRIFTSKADAVNFVRLNKDPSNANTKWEIHTTIAELKDNFSFSRDVPPNFK